MKTINPVIKKETLYVCMWTLVLSVLMQSFVFFIGKWNWSVLTGNLLGGSAAVSNFYLMCRGILSAVEKEEKDAKTMIRMSQTLRMFMLLVITALGAVLPFFNTWAVLASLFFPRIAIVFWPVFNKNKEKAESEDLNE